MRYNKNKSMVEDRFRLRGSIAVAIKEAVYAGYTFSQKGIPVGSSFTHRKIEEKSDSLMQHVYFSLDHSLERFRRQAKEVESQIDRKTDANKYMSAEEASQLTEIPYKT